MRDIRKIIIHCSYTRPNQDIDAATIRDWHVNGNGWRDIGYHYVIKRDGTVEKGRPDSQAGAHVAGQNSDSIGVCLVGGMHQERKEPDCNFTDAQWHSLSTLVDELVDKYPQTQYNVSGHRDWDNGKACPCFDVKAWLDKRG